MSINWIYIIVAVVSAVFAFILFGTHFITRLIDDKIGDIKVNMPKINVKPPQVVVRVTTNEKTGKINVVPEKVTSSKYKEVQKEKFLAVQFDDNTEKLTPVVDTVLDDTKKMLDAPIVVDTSQPATTARVLVGCKTDADCNIVNGNGNNVCKSDGTCDCIGGGSGLFCHYGPTNYRDPKDMTPEELRRFKSKFRSNFTLQDYKNWLLLYKKDPENLREQHRRNLRLLLQGFNLKPHDVPTIRMRPPTNASDYFQEMYRGGNIAVHFPDQDSPYVGANFKDFSDFVPPENIANSWVTGIVNAYKEGKDDARALDWYVLPETTIGADEQRVGDIYQRYVQRQQNLADARFIAGQRTDNKINQACDVDAIYQGYKNLQTFTEKDVSLV